MKIIKKIFLLISFMASPPFAVADNGMKQLGTHGAWRVYQYAAKNGASECFMTATPSKSKGDYAKRGPVRFFITNRPADKAQGEVSFQAGYGYGDNTQATLKIDQNKYQMPAKGEGAWLSSPAQDKEAVEKMMNGKVLVVEGDSARGTKTYDEFSLTGFSKAYQVMNKACPAQGMGAVSPSVPAASKPVEKKATEAKGAAKKTPAGKKGNTKKSPARKTPSKGKGKKTKQAAS